MGWSDVFDLSIEFAPRKWKRWVAEAIILMLAAGYLLAPATARSVVNWAVTWRAEQITETFEDLLLPPAPPAVGPEEGDAPTPSDRVRRDRKHRHASSTR